MKILIINEKPAEYGQQAVRNGEMSKGGVRSVWEHFLVQSLSWLKGESQQLLSVQTCQALLCHRRERSLSVSCCSQVGFLLAGELWIKPSLHFPLTALHFVSCISISSKVFPLHSYSFNRCQDLNWSKYKDVFFPKLLLSQPWLSKCCHSTS